jgi:hypothetical protein
MECEKGLSSNSGTTVIMSIRIAQRYKFQGPGFKFQVSGCRFQVPGNKAVSILYFPVTPQ